jgi:LuxR family transcriptional regulator, maltose regulon positive regulatory protein
MRTRPIDARLMVPPLPPLHVPRLRLIAALNGARDAPLILVSAGPGAGKTVLLSDWASRYEGSLAWLTATPADNQPRRFWRRLLSAVSAIADLDGDALSAMTPTSRPGVLLESLFTRIPSSSTPLAVVVDDAQVLTNPQVLDCLDGIVQRWPPRLRLVLAARSDPLLPLHRYQLAGQLHELRAADMAMTPSEARALLGAHGVTLPRAAFDVLAARTEGWTAGIRLSAICMADTEHPADFVAELAVDQESLGEYMISEVLTRQSGQVRQLLIQTGFLDEVSGPLVEAVTGIEGGAEILVELARSNSFVSPLDSAQTRFRYHQLFGDILRYLMQRQTPHLVPERFARAAAWYEVQGDLRNALKWAAQAGDASRAASLLARGGLARAYVYRQDDDLSDLDLLDLFRQVPDDVDKGQAAEIRTARFAITALTAGLDTAADDLERARATGSMLTDPDLQATADLAELILAEKGGNAKAAHVAAGHLLGAGSDRWSAVPGLRACILLSRARAQFWDGRHDDIGALLTDALAAAKADGSRPVELEVAGMCALVNIYWSRHGHADEAAHRARELLAEDRELTTPLTLDVAIAWRAFATGDFTAMAEHVRHAAGNNIVEWDAALAMLLTIVRGQMFLGCGRFGEARIALRAASTPSGGAPAMLSAHRDMLLASIETALGRPHGALRLLRRYRSTRFAASVALPRAHAHLALGELRDAHDCVRRMLTGARGQPGRYMLVEAVLCDAQIAQRSDDAGRALDMLVHAIEIADGDIVLPFVRTAGIFAPLIGRHPRVAAAWPTASVDDRTTVAEEVGTHDSPFLPEPLTDRERAVLRFLATSMSTAEIADELCLSVKTVKTHSAAIYRKLAARKRREAVLLARQFELL